MRDGRGWNSIIGIGSSGAGGDYADTVGKNKAKIAEYIRRQLKENEINTQMLPFDKSVWDSNKRKK